MKNISWFARFATSSARLRPCSTNTSTCISMSGHSSVRFHHFLNFWRYGIYSNGLTSILNIF
jgi:hypothetical protein